jgi:hypothetical protein
LLHESPGGEPAEAAAVASQDIGKGKISRALVLHDRYPCATWAKEVRKRVSLLAIEVTTGNELFYVPVCPVSEGKSEPVIALNGVEAAVHVPGRICVVDVRRGAIIWKREISSALSLASITQDRIALTGPSPAELDAATGRRLEAKTTRPPARPGTIEIK